MPTRPRSAHQKPPPPPRRSAAKRGYGRRWRREAKLFLEENPFCVECDREENRTVAATDVDHIVPHRGDMRIFWDRSNWQSLCRSHHGQKTGRGE